MTLPLMLRFHARRHPSCRFIPPVARRRDMMSAKMMPPIHAVDFSDIEMPDNTLSRHDKMPASYAVRHHRDSAPPLSRRRRQRRRREIYTPAPPRSPIFHASAPFRAMPQMLPAAPPVVHAVHAAAFFDDATPLPPRHAP
jgi:hypothetical protein